MIDNENHEPITGIRSLQIHADPHGGEDFQRLIKIVAKRISEVSRVSIWFWSPVLELTGARKVARYLDGTSGRFDDMLDCVKKEMSVEFRRTEDVMMKFRARADGKTCHCIIQCWYWKRPN